MATGPKIKPSSARAHTRRSTPNSPSSSKWGFGLLLLSALFAFGSWVVYWNIVPPPPQICGTQNGPPVTAPRIQLRDGRFLAYKEGGVSKEQAKYKIIAIHGYGRSRHCMLGGLSTDVIEELQVYFVGFDRAGYGESTPNPGRRQIDDVLDVQDLADSLKLGSTFYVAATSIGGCTAYGLIKYLPHRLAGVAMFAPVINYWWKGLSVAKSDNLFSQLGIGDRNMFLVAHHAPWLVYWQMTQTWLPTATVVKVHNALEVEMKHKMRKEYESGIPLRDRTADPAQQGKYESLFRDVRIMFDNWGFEPFDLENPFEGRSGTVHVWHGDQDILIPEALQRDIGEKIPWFHYHEVPGVGHSLLLHPGQADVMIRSLLTGEV